MLQNYIQILQQQTSDQLLMFSIIVKTLLLLLITSGVLFQSMLPLHDIKFVPKDVFKEFGNVRMSLTVKL